jgi:hypothetical protein
MTQMQALGHPRNGWLALAAVLMCSSPSIALATACPVRGDAKQALAKNLNVYKNRIAAPAAGQIDTSVTLAALLAPGPDLNRWDRRRAAIVEGVIVKVKTAGVESANCHAKDAAHRDTHIEIALSRSAPIARTCYCRDHAALAHENARARLVTRQAPDSDGTW